MPSQGSYTNEAVTDGSRFLSLNNTGTTKNHLGSAIKTYVWAVTSVNAAAWTNTALTTEGTLTWNTEFHTLQGQDDYVDSRIQYGYEVSVRAVNKTGATIPNGTVVWISGAQGNRPTIEPALATVGNEDRTLGMTTYAVPNNGDCRIVYLGTLDGINTSGFASGDLLYLSSTVAGAITNVQPTASNAIVVMVGRALNSTPNGRILCAINDFQPTPFGHDLSILVNSAAARALIGVVPSDANPQPDGIPTPGISPNYSRADHVHAGGTGVGITRNILINGDFSVDQYSSGTWSAGGSQSYFVDRWRAYGTGDLAVGVDSVGRPALIITGTATADLYLDQLVEDGGYCATLAGKTATVSLNLQASTSLAVVCNVYAYTSAGYLSATLVDTSTFNTSPYTDERFSSSFTLPGDTKYGLRVELIFPLQTGDFCNVRDVQLCEGTNTEFSHRGYSEELALCLRYYWTLGGYATYDKLGWGMVVTSTSADVQIQYPAPMRVAPTFVQLQGLQLSNGLASFAVGSTMTMIPNQSSPIIGTFNLQSTGMTPGAIVRLECAGGVKSAYFTAEI